VLKAVLAFACEVNRVGLGENKPHHGFTFVVGKSEELLEVDDEGEYVFMTPPKAGANMFDNKDWNILNLNDAGKRYLTLALNEDGLIVVDQTSGRIVANQCFVINLRGGGNEGGARHRSAKAIAKRAPAQCVIKASEDAMNTKTLNIFLRGNEVAHKVQEHEAPDDRAAEVAIQEAEIKQLKAALNMAQKSLKTSMDENSKNSLKNFKDSRGSSRGSSLITRDRRAESLPLDSSQHGCFT